MRYRSIRKSSGFKRRRSKGSFKRKGRGSHRKGKGKRMRSYTMSRGGIRL